MSPIISTLANGSAYGYRTLAAAGGGPSYESIASASGTGSSGTITFSSIPSTYTSLQVRAISKTSTAVDGVNSSLIRLNGDSGTNYAYHALYGDGTTASAQGVATQNSGAIYYSSVLSGTNNTNMVGTLILDLHDYASTSRYKTLRTLGGGETNGNGTSYVALTSSLWQSTAAVSSISFITVSGNWTTQTQFALYGIKGA
jgi:hypothetical protein